MTRHGGVITCVTRVRTRSHAIGRSCREMAEMAEMAEMLEMAEMEGGGG